MNIGELENKIRNAIQPLHLQASDWDAICAIFKEFKDKGGDQLEAYDLVADMYKAVCNSLDSQDRLVADRLTICAELVAGFVAPENRIWPDVI